MIKELPQTQPAASDNDLDFERPTSLSEVIDKLNEVITEVNKLSKAVFKPKELSLKAEEFLKGLNGSGGSK